jgi:hypothetical protein
MCLKATGTIYIFTLLYLRMPSAVYTAPKFVYIYRPFGLIFTSQKFNIKTLFSTYEM